MIPIQGQGGGSFSSLTGVIQAAQIPANIITDGMMASQTTSKITVPYAQISGIKLSVNNDSNSVSVTGNTPTQVKDSEFTKDVNLPAFKTLLIVARLTSSLAGQAANVRIRHDGGGSDDLVLSTTNATATVLSGTVDISGLANGLHTLQILIDDTVGNTATLDTLEIWLQ